MLAAGRQIETERALRQEEQFIKVCVLCPPTHQALPLAPDNNGRISHMFACPNHHCNSRFQEGRELTFTPEINARSRKLLERRQARLAKEAASRNGGDGSGQGHVSSGAAEGDEGGAGVPSYDEPIEVRLSLS